jgi:hypothetical protein
MYTLDKTINLILVKMAQKLKKHLSEAEKVFLLQLIAKKYFRNTSWAVKVKELASNSGISTSVPAIKRLWLQYRRG